MMHGLRVFNTIPPADSFGAVIVAVPHNHFLDISADEWSALVGDKGVIVDLKGIVPRSLCPFRL